MKKAVYITIYVLVIIGLSSCRSTSSSCGLTDNTTTNKTALQQINVT